jgi:hypothetical protein
VALSIVTNSTQIKAAVFKLIIKLRKTGEELCLNSAVHLALLTMQFWLLAYCLIHISSYSSPQYAQPSSAAYSNNYVYLLAA